MPMSGERHGQKRPKVAKRLAENSAPLGIWEHEDVGVLVIRRPLANVRLADGEYPQM